MIDIGSRYFRLQSPSCSKEELEDYAVRLYKDWESDVDKQLKLSDYSLVIEVRSGSLIAVAVIYASYRAVVGFITEYPKISVGIKTLCSDIKLVKSAFSRRASKPFLKNNEKPRIRDQGNDLRKIESIINRVEKGQLSVNEALILLREFDVGEDDSSKYELAMKLMLEKLPSQINIPLHGGYADEIKVLKNKPSKLNPKDKKKRSKKDRYSIKVTRVGKADDLKVDIKKI
jgi:hypothetical protein